MNKLFKNSKKELLKLDFSADTLKMALVSKSYTPNLKHKYFSEINGVVAAQTLTNVTLVDGVVNCANPQFSLQTGTQVEYIVIYKEIGDKSPLLVFIDSANGIPFISNGTPFTAVVDFNGPRLLRMPSNESCEEIGHLRCFQPPMPSPVILFKANLTPPMHPSVHPNPKHIDYLYDKVTINIPGMVDPVKNGQIFTLYGNDATIVKSGYTGHEDAPLHILHEQH